MRRAFACAAQSLDSKGYFGTVAEAAMTKAPLGIQKLPPRLH